MKYDDIEALLMNARIEQQASVTRGQKMADMISKTWDAMRNLNEKLNAVAQGVVPLENIEGVSRSEARRFLDGEGFVNEMHKIQSEASCTIRMKKYSELLVNLKECRDSVQSKYDKLSERIEYLIRNDTKSEDYVVSCRLRTRTKDTMLIISKRMELVLDRFFACRKRLMASVMSMTNKATSIVGDKDAVRKCILKNDDYTSLYSMIQTMKRLKKEI